jgi:hypothetical protein
MESLEQFGTEGIKARAVECGDWQDLDAGEAGLDGCEVFLGLREIRLVGEDEPRAFGEVFVVEGDFLPEDREIAAGVAGFTAGGIDHEEEETAAKEVAEEFVAEPDILVGSFDEAGDIRDDDAAVFREFDYADHGVQRGEGVGGDLGSGSAQSGEERAFAGVGKPDEACVGDLPEFEIEMTSFAGSPFGELVGDAVGGGFEVVIALSSATAAAQHEFLAEFREVGALINEVLDGLAKNGEEGNDKVEKAVAAKVKKLTAKFPIY